MSNEPRDLKEIRLHEVNLVDENKLLPGMKVPFIEEVQRLAPLASLPYVASVAQAAQEFEGFAARTWAHHGLKEAYSLEEVMHACKEVCAHSAGMPGLEVMRLLAGGNVWLVRDFICELGKISRKEQQ